MSIIDYKALAERVKAMARSYEDRSRVARTTRDDRTSERHAECAADLRTVVTMLNGMAEAEPAARIYTDAELVHRDPRWGRVCWIVPECEIDGGALLYLHPAPQPQPTAIPAPFMHLLGHAYGLSLGTDWNRGTHAEHYRRPLLDAVATCKRWLGSAPQPQPERQPVSEQADNEADLIRIRDVMRKYGWQSRDCCEEILALFQPQPGSEPTEAQIEYEILCNGEWVAGASGPGAEAEILHYLTQYEQDGPCEVYAVTRCLVDRAALAAKEN